MTFAWDPQLCDVLLPRFSEHIFFAPSFIGCDTLRAAVIRAFSSWSANHPSLHFEDVSKLCDASTRYADPSRGCSHAEIYITYVGNRPEQVSLNTDSLAAFAKQTYAYTSNLNYQFRSTNGHTSSKNLYTVLHSEVGFNPSYCWYLDSTFCSYFHVAKEAVGADTLLLAVQISFFVVWSLVLLEAAWCSTRRVRDNVAVSRLASKAVGGGGSAWLVGRS